MKPWKHYNPVRIHMQQGCRKNIANLLPKTQDACLLITSQGMLTRGTAQELVAILPTHAHIHTVAPNPDLDIMDADHAHLRQHPLYPFGAIIALGGGSVMDAAKAFSHGLAPHAPQKPLDAWLRKNHDIAVQPLPLFCLPTTAGTGAEVTPFGTIWDTAQQKKRSFVAESAFAHTALLDPELTYSLPMNETLIGTLDALSHAMETLWNVKATPCSISYALTAIDLICKHFPTMAQDVRNARARQGLQEAACIAGLAICQSRTAIAHAISYPLTLHFGMPHGFACSLLLAPIAAHVTAHSAWHPMALGHYEKAVHFLEEYALPKYFTQYCTAEQALAHLDEMFTPERENTLTAPINKEDIKGFFDIFHGNQ